MNNNLSQVKAMTFDVFGTVVDWRSSIAREIKEMGQRKGFVLDWDSFADEWRSGYKPAMDKVRNGELPWTKIDTLHRMILDEMLTRHQISNMSEDEKDYLNRAWHRLDPWPDSVKGLTLLKKRSHNKFPIQWQCGLISQYGQVWRVALGYCPFR